jgi:hypothetical protein
MVIHPEPAPPSPITPTTQTSLLDGPLRPLAGQPLQTQQRMVLRMVPCMVPRMVPCMVLVPIRKEAAPLNGAGFIAPTALIQTPPGNMATPRPAYCKTSTL